MAATITWTEDAAGKDVFGGKFVRFGTLSVAGTTTLGGDALTAAQVGFGRILHVSVPGATNGGYVPYAVVSGTGALIKLFRQSAATGALDEADAVDVSTQTMPALIIGR